MMPSICGMHVRGWDLNYNLAIESLTLDETLGEMDIIYFPANATLTQGWQSLNARPHRFRFKPTVHCVSRIIRPG